MAYRCSFDCVTTARHDGAHDAAIVRCVCSENVPAEPREAAEHVAQEAFGHRDLEEIERLHQYRAALRGNRLKLLTTADAAGEHAEVADVAHLRFGQRFEHERGEGPVVLACSRMV